MRRFTTKEQQFEEKHLSFFSGVRELQNYLNHLFHAGTTGLKYINEYSPFVWAVRFDKKEGKQVPIWTWDDDTKHRTAIAREYRSLCDKYGLDAIFQFEITQDGASPLPVRIDDDSMREVGEMAVTFSRNGYTPLVCVIHNDAADEFGEPMWQHAHWLVARTPDAEE